MTMTLDLAPELEAYLRKKAAREGQAAEAVAQALLKGYGISPAQAAELRASFATFAGEWERPEMDVYDDYDAARVRLSVNS